MINADICETKIQMFYDRASGINERVNQLTTMSDSELRSEYVMDCWRRNRLISDEINSFQRSMGEVDSSDDTYSVRWVLHRTSLLQDSLAESRMRLMSYL